MSDADQSDSAFNWLFDSTAGSSIVKFCLRALIPLTIVVVMGRLSLADNPSAEQLEYFEKQVRPLFVQNCHDCHGAKKQEAGLRLDTQAGFLKGSDSGPIFAPENVDGSRLFDVLLYKDGGTQMPPKGKLFDEQIAIVRKWLEMGAPWPVEAAQSATSAKDHWAFQPVKRSAIPTESSVSLEQRRDQRSALSTSLSPIDSFISASLAEKQLAMSQPASRETFIRRATVDLWGIPPTFEAACEFVEDASPDAYERLIDRLLASPLYGQRWGRHWLDIARYADSKGYVFTQEPRYPYSYTYRDYVIDAFNADKPFDRFVTEQLAADLLVEGEQKPPAGSGMSDPRLAALGFLTVGRRYLNNNQDIIDDRIDVVSRGLLGLTVGCARCHDHKFDPIPTADYYSLYGVFSSTTEPDDLPVIGEAKNPAAYQAFLTELANREAAVLKYEQESLPKLVNEIRDVAGDALQQIARQNPIWAQSSLVLNGSNDPRAPLVQRWQDLLNKTASQQHTVLGPWHRLAKVAKAEEFSAEVNSLIESWSHETEAALVNPLVRQAIIEQKPTTLVELARVYGKLLRDVQAEWSDLQKTMPDAKLLPNSAAEEVRQLLYGEGSPANITLDQARPAFGRDIKNTVTKLKRKVDDLRVTSPDAPPRAMVVRDGQIHEPVIFIRGNAGRPGKPVPRQFLEIASASDRKPFAKGSGRLELAEAIVDPKNPLTARVFVNRIWQHHFGVGLVPTPSDFGMRGMPPSHPQLLDWLAAETTNAEVQPSPVSSPRRWSLKSMHRLVMTSAVYRQSSTENPVARGIDPENRLLWRMPRQRLDFEALRDSLLAVSGKLDPSLEGQPFDGVMNPSKSRRTIYTFINRNDLPGIFRAFDFADTDSSAAERPQTTVPQQSLFAMNSPFVHEQARRLAAECTSSATNDTDRLRLLYQRVFSRIPTAGEQRMALQFLSESQTTETEKLSPWDRLAQLLLMTNEFTFVD